MSYPYKQSLMEVIDKLSKFPPNSTVEINYDVPRSNYDTCITVRDDSGDVIGELPFGDIF